MSELRRTDRLAWLSVALLIALLVQAPLGCDRHDSDDGATTETPRSETASTDDSTPAVIDADWVASKFQAPPAPKERNWIREIEKDPIAALKEMDPAALQPSRNRTASSGPSGPVVREIRPQNRAHDEPDKPLNGWPPVVGQFYPNVVVKDQAGQVTAISDFQGKVILLELVGLTCRACHAFAGGNEPGMVRFRNIEPQQELSSIERLTLGYAKLSLDHPDIVFVQLVLYGMDGRSPPTEQDVRAWASHFNMDRQKNQVVLIGDQRFISPATRRLIPGFHLIDQNGILRAMSSNDPRHDPLHSSLLPKLASLVDGE